MTEKVKIDCPECLCKFDIEIKPSSLTPRQQVALEILKQYIDPTTSLDGDKRRIETAYRLADLFLDADKEGK